MLAPQQAKQEFKKPFMKLPVNCRLTRTSEIYKQLKCKGPTLTHWNQLVVLLDDVNDDQNNLTDMADLFKCVGHGKIGHITYFLESCLSKLTSEKYPDSPIGRLFLLVWLWPHKSQ